MAVKHIHGDVLIMGTELAGCLLCTWMPGQGHRAENTAEEFPLNIIGILQPSENVL